MRTFWEHGRGELLQSALVQRRLEEASALFQLSSEKNLRLLLPLPSVSSGEIGSTEHGVYLAPPPYSEDPKCQEKKRTDQWSRPEWEEPPPPPRSLKPSEGGKAAGISYKSGECWRDLWVELGRVGCPIGFAASLLPHLLLPLQRRPQSSAHTVNQRQPFPPQLPPPLCPSLPGGLGPP